MTDPSHLPTALYQANLDLWLRIGQLLEDNRGQWMELLARELQDRTAEARAGADLARSAQDWPAMAMLPGSTLWRIAEQQIGDLQALAQTATGNQMTFVNGFQQALADWQQATAEALAGATGDAAQPAQLFRNLQGALDQLSASLLPAASAAAASAAPAGTAAKKSARRPAARTAARKRPATRPTAAAGPARKSARKAAKKSARSTAAKKTATRKPAAKKTTAAKSPARKSTRKAARKTAPR